METEFSARRRCYLAAYFVIALPTAFAATAIQFSVALRHGRAMAAYLASVLLLVASQWSQS